MRGSITAALQRVYAVLGRLSMYRLMVLVLGVLALVSFGVSFTGQILPTPGDFLATTAVLVAVVLVVDLGMHRLLRLPMRAESSLITAGLLLFMLAPSIEPAALAGAAIAAAAAALSKYAIAWRGRHVLNPAATGAVVLSLLSALFPDAGLGFSAWWTGSPILGPVVLLLGLVVLMRTEKVRVFLVFYVVALVAYSIRGAVQYAQADAAFDLGTALGYAVWSMPFLFLGVFMLSEPLTLPPRRWQQLVVAVVVGVLAGWAPVLPIGVSLGDSYALLIGNVVAFAFAARSGVRLTLRGRSTPTPGVQELTFHSRGRLGFRAGQYLELEVPHRRADSRGTRREFSIVSAPEDLPIVRVAYRDGAESRSTYKRALAEVDSGERLAITGTWGDFVLPKDPAHPILMVAAGIGVTPFVSQLRHLTATRERRDVVLVLAASDATRLAFRDDIAAAGVPVVVFTRDEPTHLPEGWTWAGGTRIDAASLERAVPDIADRHAYASGPPALIADLAPALKKARSIRTDAFSGY